jgi:hypothetical protein
MGPQLPWSGRKSTPKSDTKASYRPPAGGPIESLLRVLDLEDALGHHEGAFIVRLAQIGDGDP